MAFKKMMDKIDKMQLDNKIILFVFLIIGMFAGLAYIGSLIVPNWEGFLVFTWLHQLVAYTVIGLILLDLTFVIIITLKTAINNQMLSKTNIELDSKIIELEIELKDLRDRV